MIHTPAFFTGNRTEDEMGSNSGWGVTWSRVLAVALVEVIAVLVPLGGAGRLAAAPINPLVYKAQFEAARKDAEVVAQVRVLAVVCTEAANKEGNGAVTLQVALQVLEAEKGPVKKQDVLVVSRQVTPAAGPGPRAYGYMAAQHQFPFTPGVKGSVALRWDPEQRRYAAIAGWVPELNHAPIPTEVGKACVAAEEGSAK
jgi:hypothetical protein